MELHYRTVIPSAQVVFQGPYSYVLIFKLLLSNFEVVSVIFEKGRYHFALFPTFCT